MICHDAGPCPSRRVSPALTSGPQGGPEAGQYDRELREGQIQEEEWLHVQHWLAWRPPVHCSPLPGATP
eukprot:955503-Rhodomonas_salina.1